MNRRTVVLVAALPAVLGLSLLGTLAWGLESHGGPSADDPHVVSAHEAGQDRLAGVVDELLAVVPGEVLDRRTSDECTRGRRAMVGLGVDDPYALRCQALAVSHVRGAALDAFDAEALALHERLVADGWLPSDRALPQLVADLRGPVPAHSDGGFDGRRGPADLAAAGYVAADGTELSLLLSERDEHPAGPVDDRGARGWETADRLGSGEYGVVLRVSAVTFEG